MIRFDRRMLLVPACLFLLADALPLAAAEVEKAPPLSAIVVDVQRILDESLAAKSVQKQLEMQRSKFQSVISKEENDLRQAEQDLTKSRDQLTADVYTDREQQLRQRFLTVERHVQARRKVLDQAFSDSMNTVRTNLLDVVKDITRERGVNLVLIKQQVLWMDKTLDYTDQVLERLNSRLSEVTVKMAPEENAEKDVETTK